MRITAILLTAPLLFVFAQGVMVKADTAFLDQKDGPPIPCEAVIFKADANGTSGLRLDKGMFVTELGLSTRVGREAPKEKQAIFERWKLAGWTATVTLATRQTRVFNCEIQYPPPKGSMIVGSGIPSEDYLKLMQNGIPTIVQFAEMDRIVAVPNESLAITLRSGVVLTGKILPAPIGNGELRPTFHGVQRFPQSGSPIWFDADLSKIKVIQFEKRVEPQHLTAYQFASLKPAKIEDLRTGINVILIKDRPLTERGKVFRTASAGETFIVSIFSSAGSEVRVFARNERGEMITVEVPLDAIALANP